MATNIVIPDTVLKRLNDLLKKVRIKFWKQLERLTANPSYPGLRNEKLKGTDAWAFSITMNYRAIYVRSKMGIIITAVGTHKEVLCKKLSEWSITNRLNTSRASNLETCLTSIFCITSHSIRY